MIQLLSIKASAYFFLVVGEEIQNDVLSLEVPEVDDILLALEAMARDQSDLHVVPIGMAGFGYVDSHSIVFDKQSQSSYHKGNPEPSEFLINNWNVRRGLFLDQFERVRFSVLVALQQVDPFGQIAETFDQKLIPILALREFFYPLTIDVIHVDLN